MQQQEERQHPRSLSVEVMYSYREGTNDPFNFPQYQPVKKYECGPEKKALEKKATKKGSFMDYMLKVAAGVPSPQHYKEMRLWSARSNKSPKIDKSLKKYSYIDLIETEQKNRGTPAPNRYQIGDSDKDIEQQKKDWDVKSRKRPVSQKRYFYQDMEHLSNAMPGPGNYNPRPIKHKLRLNKKDHKFWTDKHKSQTKSFTEREKKKPDMGSYSPVPIDFGTFDRIGMTTARLKKQKKVTVKPWGTGQRFAYSTATSKKKIVQKRPDMTTYNLILDWPDKPHPKIKAKEKRNTWINRVSHPSVSVYH